jgi:hypothetical protein
MYLKKTEGQMPRAIWTISLSVLLLSLTAAPSQAHFMTGNDLVEICNEKVPLLCRGVIAGYFDTMGALGYTCESVEHVTLTQTVSVVRKYLQDNPQDLNVPATYLGINAIQNAFKCKYYPKP